MNCVSRLNLLNIFKGTKKENLLWQSRYLQITVQVWEREALRELRFGNHIMQSVFSKARPNHLVLPYTRFMLLGLLLCPEPKSVLHIGLGGGSIARWLYREIPNINQVVFEVNPGVIEAAYRFFDFPKDSRLQVYNKDASKVIPILTEEFDLVFLDAFSDYGAPEELTRIEFLMDLRDCINSSGWVVGNLWTMTGDFIEQCGKWRSTFSKVLTARANKKGNVILFGSKNSQTFCKEKLEQKTKIMQGRHQLEFQKMIRELKTIL